MILRPRALAACLLLLSGACSSGGDEDGDRRDPDAPFVRWSVPTSGLPSPIWLGPIAPAPPAFDAGTTIPPPPPPTIADEGAAADEDAGPPMEPDPTLAILDPDRVYLFGTLVEGASRSAIADVHSPNQALSGFSSHAHGQPGFVRPSDGRFVYRATFDDDFIYAFHCDGCTYATLDGPYPTDTTANDEKIPTTVCTRAGDFLGGFTVTAEGAVLIRCGSGRWFDTDDRELAPLEGLTYLEVSAGHQGTALIPEGVVDLDSGELAPLTGLTTPTVLAQRAREDGYWVAIRTDDELQHPELWHVAFDGTATEVGVYPELPADQESLGDHALDGEGALYELTRKRAPDYRDTIVRRSLSGESTVVYDEADDPILKRHASDLFTGP